MKNNVISSGVEKSPAFIIGAKLVLILLAIIIVAMLASCSGKTYSIPKHQVEQAAPQVATALEKGPDLLDKWFQEQRIPQEEYILARIVLDRLIYIFSGLNLTENTIDKNLVLSLITKLANVKLPGGF